ncbi:ABC transporter ATP-binding protein [Marinivivus vitaminiproducens]|uniref:ABC transporter ATP-binding protein n=1 Tax=Marinivivus vitaminiproducens TaxID=3035935 RepID=UPI0027A28D8F|nr:sn-glycerol-3-phosphate ABC transporter ATP-binding protein UgpC [Geminicoccaceae bacterium SCSIO 64248]
MADVALKDVRKSFGRAEVIHGVDLDIASNEFVVFVGPSGCGKSTLLRLIAGLEDITSGDLLFDGDRVNDRSPSERGIAMVFQSYALYPHMSVRQNMEFGLKLGKYGKEEIGRRVDDAAKVLQIEHLMDRKPKALSGGQRQRVAIGRAIVREPRVFLFDEPLSNLDASLRVQMRIEIARLHHSMDSTMIYVTHDQIEAMTLADKIVVLQGGVVEQVGSPLDLYHHPDNRFVAGFIGSPRMNFLKAGIGGVGETGIEVRLPGDRSVIASADADRIQAGDEVALGVRPEHLALGEADGAALQGEALAVEHLGGETYVYVDQGGEQPLIVKTEGEAAVRSGETVHVHVPSEAIYLFDTDGRAHRRRR